MTFFRDMKVSRPRASTNLNTGTRQPVLLLEAKANGVHDWSGVGSSVGTDSHVSDRRSGNTRGPAAVLTRQAPREKRVLRARPRRANSEGRK